MDNYYQQEQTTPPPPPLYEPRPQQNSDKKLYRSNTDRIVWGVCGGLGEYFGLDSLIFRLIFVALTLSGGAGLLFYIVLAIITPSAPTTEKTPDDREEKIKQFAHEVGGKIRDLASEIKITEKHKDDSRLMIGFVIFFLGLVLLLRVLFPWELHWLNWNFFWPAIIIIIGLYLMMKK